MGRKRKLPRYVERITRKDGSDRYRSYVPSGVAGRKDWLPVVDTIEEALDTREEALAIEKEGIPVRCDWTWTAVAAAALERVHKFRKPGHASWFESNLRCVSRAMKKAGLSPSTPVIRIRSEDWQRVRDVRLSEVSTNSVIAHFRAIRMVYTWATRNGVVRSSPLAAVELPRETTKEMTWITEAELWDVVDFIEEEDHPEGQIDSAIFAVLFLTGLRRRELAEMPISCVQLGTRRCWVDGKIRAETMGIPAAAVEFFEVLMGDRKDGRVLEGGDGRLRRAFQRWVDGKSMTRLKNPDEKRKVGKKRKREKFLRPGLLPDDRFADIKARLHPHALRHSFVTALVPELVRMGKTYKEMLQLTRLRSYTMLDRYLHVTADPRALDVLGRKRRAKVPFSVVADPEPPEESPAASPGNTRSESAE